MRPSSRMPAFRTTGRGGGVAMRIIVTGGNGKLGRAVVAHLKEHGHDVFVFDKLARPRARLLHRRPHRLRPGARRGARHRGEPRRRRRAGAPRRDPGARHRARRRRRSTTTCPRPTTSSGRAPGRHQEDRLRVERDRARPAVRRRPALHPGRRGVPRPPREHVLARSSTSRRRWRRSSCRWDPELSIIGLRFSNVMEPGRLRRVPVVRRRPDAAQVEPLGLHRRPRRRPGRARRRSRMRGPGFEASSSRTPTR